MQSCDKLLNVVSKKYLKNLTYNQDVLNNISYKCVDNYLNYIQYVVRVCTEYVLDTDNKFSVKDLLKIQIFLTYILKKYSEQINSTKDEYITLLNSCIHIVESFRREFDFYQMLRKLNFYKDISYRNTVESVSDYYSQLVEAELLSKDYKDSYEVL